MMGISIAAQEGLKDLIREIHANAMVKGFWNEPSNTAEKVVLIHGELSEFMEELRKPEIDADNLVKELADVVIRTFDLAEGLGMDIVKAILEKHQFNKTRPYLHGKRF